MTRKKPPTFTPGKFIPRDTDEPVVGWVTV
jgi:hypothetical protein